MRLKAPNGSVVNVSTEKGDRLAAQVGWDVLEGGDDDVDLDDPDLDLNKLKVGQLAKLAEQEGIDPKGLKKADLIEALTSGD